MTGGEPCKLSVAVVSFKSKALKTQKNLARERKKNVLFTPFGKENNVTWVKLQVSDLSFLAELDNCDETKCRNDIGHFYNGVSWLQLQLDLSNYKAASQIDNV